MKKTLLVLTGVCAAIALLSVLRGSAHAELLTLSQGLKLAAEKNRTIKITQQQEKMSEADTLVARAGLLPSLNASASQTFLSAQPMAIFGPQVVPTAEKSFAAYSLGIRQLLYDFEGTASRYKASKSVLETKRLDTLRVRNQVSLDFALVYFDVLESEKLILVAQKEVESVTSHLHDAKILYDNGVITKNDLLQAEVRLAAARQRFLNAKNLRAINASRLNTVLSLPVNADVQVVDLPGLPSGSLLPDRERAWDTALRERPEIRITDETMRSLDLEETAKKSEFYPRFFAGASYDYTENRYMLHQGNASLMLGMSINLFSGGSTRAEVAKTEYQKVQLTEQRARLGDEIRLEVERSILDLENARERIIVAKDSVGQAEENLRINKVRYEEGVGTATEVLDAVTLLTVAEINHYRALYDFRRAESALFYSLGKDLSEVYQ